MGSDSLLVATHFSAFLQRPNRCDLESGIKLLTEYEMLHELMELFKSCCEHRRALELLQVCVRVMRVVRERERERERGRERESKHTHNHTHTQPTHTHTHSHTHTHRSTAMARRNTPSTVFRLRWSICGRWEPNTRRSSWSFPAGSSDPTLRYGGLF